MAVPIARIIALLLCCVAATSRSDDLEMKDLGIRMRHLPGPLGDPIVLRRPHGWGASAQNNAVVVDIYRQLDLTAENIVITDPKLQSSLLAKFETQVPPEVPFKLVKVDGRDALVLVGASRLRAYANVPRFYCHVYMLVDHQLVRLTVDALGPLTRPPEFDQAVAAILGSSFEPVSHESSAAAAPAATSRVFPPHLVYKTLPYPEHELQTGDGGIVDVEFGVDNNGHLQGFKQTYTDLKGLGELVPVFLRSTLFWLPADWDESQTVSL
jgi:hypothetical protein